MNNLEAEVYADLGRRYAGGEKIQAAGMVYWDVTQTEEKQGGLAGRATSGMRAKDLAFGLVLGPAGVLASVATDKHEPAKCTCQLGILAVGSRRVFLLTLGRVSMTGESALCARLPSQLTDRIPQKFTATGVIAFRPLSASDDIDLLRVQVLGKPPASSDSAFIDGGSCLVVHAPGLDAGDSLGACSLATIIKNFATYPQPEKVMASFFVADKPPLSQSLENAFGEPDYVQSFAHFYQRQKKEVRHAWILVARAGPASLKAIAEACVKNLGTGLGIGGRIFLNLLCIIFLVVGCLCFWVPIAISPEGLKWRMASKWRLTRRR